MTLRKATLRWWLVFAVVMAGLPIILSGCCEVQNLSETLTGVDLSAVGTLIDLLTADGAVCDAPGPNSVTCHVDPEVLGAPPEENLSPADVTISWVPNGDLYDVTISVSVAGCGGVNIELIAPSLWLSDVCEPNNGFSADGWMTLDTDADNLGKSTALMVAASQEGPWLTLTAAGPPWVLNQANFDAIAANVGIASYTDLWMKVGDSGRAFHLGSMVRDRDYHMDELCGVTE